MKRDLSRLEIALEHFKKQPEITINMLTWEGSHECGTTYCFVGHACNIPQFNKLGFKMVFKEPTYIDIYDGPGKEQDISGIDAVDEFFNLSRRESSELFISSNYKQRFPTKQDVIDKIENFIDASKE